MENIKKRMLELHKVVFGELPEKDYLNFLAKNSDLENRALPLIMYSVDYIRHSNKEEVIDYKVKEIIVTRFYCRAGYEYPTISFTDRIRSSVGSVSSFYLTEEGAQREVDYLLKLKARSDAKKELKKLIKKHLPEVL